MNNDFKLNEYGLNILIKLEDENKRLKKRLKTLDNRISYLTRRNANLLNLSSDASRNKPYFNIRDIEEMTIEEILIFLKVLNFIYSSELNTYHWRDKCKDKISEKLMEEYNI